MKSITLDTSENEFIISIDKELVQKDNALDGENVIVETVEKQLVKNGHGR